MTTVTAAVIREPEGKFDVEEFELDEIRPNEVRVRVALLVSATPTWQCVTLCSRSRCRWCSGTRVAACRPAPGRS